ncbi:MAG: type III-B CRISPR module-associated protein Cmr5 [Verrucomicrobiae bacterium]|nr:type III-B CRISPR module-associated protein Cmr5 [Verrucomicrobiae bacterium]
MKNLEQIRAAHALKPAESLDRSAINKLPALILTNGLLATAAFCEAESSGEGRSHMKRAMDATADHLVKRGLLAAGKNTTKGLIEDLSQRDSHHLQRATAEALAFIGYLKRFAPKKD